MTGPSVFVSACCLTARNSTPREAGNNIARKGVLLFEDADRS